MAAGTEICGLILQMALVSCILCMPEFRCVIFTKQYHFVHKICENKVPQIFLSAPTLINPRRPGNKANRGHTGHRSHKGIYG